MEPINHVRSILHSSAVTKSTRSHCAFYQTRKAVSYSRSVLFASNRSGKWGALYLGALHPSLSSHIVFPSVSIPLVLSGRVSSRSTPLRFSPVWLQPRCTVRFHGIFSFTEIFAASIARCSCERLAKLARWIFAPDGRIHYVSVVSPNFANSYLLFVSLNTYLNVLRFSLLRVFSYFSLRCWQDVGVFMCYFIRCWHNPLLFIC